MEHHGYCVGKYCSFRDTGRRFLTEIFGWTELSIIFEHENPGRHSFVTRRCFSSFSGTYVSLHSLLICKSLFTAHGNYIYICSVTLPYKAFSSLRVFGLLSSSLLLFSKRFSRYVLRPSSGVCRTQESSRNFELRPLLNPRGSPVLISLAITGYKC